MQSNKIELENTWNQFHSQLKGFIYSKVKDPALADDILHDVYLKVHSGISTIKYPERIKSWLFQITRNIINDYYRNRKIATEISETSAISDGDFDMDPHKRIQRSIYKMIKTMPEIYKDALIKTEYEGMSQLELAEKLGISYPASKARVQRARKLLKDMLLQCCHFEFDIYGKIIDYYQISNDCCKKKN